MDDRARFYRARYFLAEQLARSGRTGEALELCTQLSSKHDLSIWRRACVNVLIAKLINIANHTDKRRFAAKALDLLMQIRTEAGFLSDDEGRPLPRSAFEDGHGLTNEEEKQARMLEDWAVRIIMEVDRHTAAIKGPILDEFKLHQQEAPGCTAKPAELDIIKDCRIQ